MTAPAHLTIASALAVASLLATEAASGDTGQLTFDGYLELEYLNGAIDDTFLVGDIFARYSSPAGLGFDAGIVGITDFDSSETALYAALTYSFGESKISVGIPRPAYNAFGNFPAVGGQRVLQLGLGTLNGDVAELAYLLGDTDPPLGLRYDGEFGRFKLAASALHFDDIDATDYALALRYAATSNIAVLADWESFDTDGGPDISTGRIGTELSFSSFQSGLAYFSRTFDGAAPDVDGTETWVTYFATPELSVTGTALNTNVFDILGLSLRYERAIGASFPAKVYGQIGVSDGRSIDATYDVSVGLKF